MDELSRLIEAARRGDIEQVTTILQSDSDLVHRRDERGATALHHAALGGHRGIVRLLVEKGADINARDTQFGATPAGWAIEYMREMGGFLAIELADCAHAITREDVEWVRRFVQRNPAFRGANAPEGKSLKSLAEQTGNPEIAELFR